MLAALRTISRLVTPAVETQVQKILRSAPAVCTPPSTTLRPLSANVVTSHVNLYTNPLRMCAKMAQPPKKPSLLSGAMADIKYGVSQSFKRLFAPRGSSGAHKLLAGLNRFDPLLQFNPQAIWRLQTFYRSYITLGVSLMSTLLYFSSVLGTPDSTMRLSLVPIRFWDGDYERLFTSPFLHTSLFHLLTVSGFFLAFSTAVEVAAGPVALISVLASCAIAGGAAALCAPERRPNLYIERVQAGLWPTTLGLMGFFWYGLKRTTHEYVMKNPNLSTEDKLRARQLTATLTKRRLPFLLAAAFAFLPFASSDTTTAGSLVGLLTGSLMGYMWTRSPHLILINGAMVAGGLTWLAKEPSWTLSFQAYQFATAWENGEFLRAREWLRRFEVNSKNASREGHQWVNVMSALTEMACGRTSVALDYADLVNMNNIVLASDLSRIRQDMAKTFAKEQNQKRQDSLPTFRWRVSPSQEAYAEQYQELLKEAPWRIMNDEDIGTLFYGVFYKQPPKTAEEMQSLILHHYKGLFNFDPSYERGFILAPHSSLNISKQNPLQS